jgi:hypothetical protein
VTRGDGKGTPQGGLPGRHGVAGRKEDRGRRFEQGTAGKQRESPILEAEQEIVPESVLGKGKWDRSFGSELRNSRNVVVSEGEFTTQGQVTMEIQLTGDSQRTMVTWSMIARRSQAEKK